MALASLATADAAGSRTLETKRPQLPRSGEYSGHTDEGRDLTIQIVGKSVELVAFQFECDQVAGNTSLQDVHLERTDRGWRFGIDAHAAVTYSDYIYYPDENAAVSVFGKFTRSGKRVRGRLHVEAPRCRTGRVEWRAHRR
jgi:hypothetical protein